jgi:hypothetical protein
MNKGRDSFRVNTKDAFAFSLRIQFHSLYQKIKAPTSLPTYRRHCLYAMHYTLIFGAVNKFFQSILLQQNK